MQRNNISSTANPSIKHIVKLRDRKTRDDEGLTIVEGVKEVSLALDSNMTLKEVYVGINGDSDGISELLGRVKDKGIKIFETSKDVFSKISYGSRQDGILAVGKPEKTSFDGLKLKSDPLVVIVEQVEKPGNLGAILRTCDGAGIDALIVTDGATDLYNPNVIRASLGTIFSVPVVSATNEETMQFLEKNNIKSCAAVPDAEVVYSQSELLGPLAIVVGSEQKGLSEFWRERSDVQIRIPMAGKADSLNLSVTTAVIVYEAVRQRL